LSGSLVDFLHKTYGSAEFAPKVCRESPNLSLCCS